jgi:NADH/NAD ratio-sensing transcriptional regulator Rex
MKRKQFYDIAERMYVEQFITEEEIARRIGVCDRTIRRWKAMGDWGLKRDGFYKVNTISKDAMYALVRKMLDDFHTDLDNHYSIDPSRLNIFINLTEELLKQKKASYKVEELLKIARKTFNIDEEIKSDYQDMLREMIWEDDF